MPGKPGRPGDCTGPVCSDVHASECDLPGVCQPLRSLRLVVFRSHSDATSREGSGS